MTVFITSCTPPSAPSTPLPPVPQAPAYDWTEDYSEVTLDTVKVTGTVNYSTSEPTESTYSTFYFDGSKWYCRNGSSEELVLESLSKYFSLFVTNTDNYIHDFEPDNLCAIIGTDSTVYQYGIYDDENGTCEGLYREYLGNDVTTGKSIYAYEGADVLVKPLDKFTYILYANGTVKITEYHNENANDAYVNSILSTFNNNHLSSLPIPIYVYSANSSN